MTKTNLIVVGAGLFGSIIATHARSRGYDVTVIGQSRQYEASPASGCVLSPNWLNSMPSEDISDALSVLKEHYTLVDLKFKTNILSTFKAKHIDPASILIEPDIVGKVLAVRDNEVIFDKFGVPHTMHGTVIVAAGIWSKELIPDMPAIKGLYGASLRFAGHIEPSLHVYAPYRQSVGFNISEHEVWFGDGSALIQNTWRKEREERIERTTNRARSMCDAEDLGEVTVTEGARPYVEDHKGGYLRQVSDGLWVSTGGAKNGTVLAASHAHKIVQALEAV
jgi:glycine/D-amino acid oxidase-like deaminating enzyme